MIEITKMDGTKTLINQDLIETVESTPDTVVTLTTGRKIITKESRQEIDNLVKSYRKEIYANLPIFDRLLGIVICLALVIFGIVAGNGFGVIVNFLDLNSALITFGGAFCSVMASNTMPDFVAGIKAIGLIFKAQSADTPEVIKKIIDLSNVARKE